MASKSAKGAFQYTKQVKPLLSLDHSEARLRVLSLYKAWFRQIPFMLIDFSEAGLTEKRAKMQLKKKFEENKHVKDLRVIDMLVVKGQQDLREVAENWAQPVHLMSKFFREGHKERPKDFLSKFLEGKN